MHNTTLHTFLAARLQGLIAMAEFLIIAGDGKSPVSGTTARSDMSMINLVAPRREEERTTLKVGRLHVCVTRFCLMCLVDL